jgi:hypothetical protein
MRSRVLGVCGLAVASEPIVLQDDDGERDENCRCERDGCERWQQE